MADISLGTRVYVGSVTSENFKNDAEVELKGVEFSGGKTRMRVCGYGANLDPILNIIVSIDVEDNLGHGV